MIRNLDMTTLRSFVAVADQGGVTRGAASLNLTQSAVSMQLKRLEDMLGIALLERNGRRVALTAPGEQLLSYARRMITLNDELVGRLTEDHYEGQLTLGVPHDIVYPVIPRVLKTFNTLCPRVKVQLRSWSTMKLLEALDRGEIDLILTTETSLRPGGETLTEMPLRWVGGRDALIWKTRPLRLAFCKYCIFKPTVLRALDAAGIDWDMAVDSDDDRAVEALISADLAMGALLEDSIPPHLAALPAGCDLPDLGAQQINMYAARTGDEVLDELGAMLRQGFGAAQPPSLRKV